MKLTRCLPLALAAVLLLSAHPAGAAAHGADAAGTLRGLGLFQGTDKGDALDKEATRAEAAAMLVRLLGREADARWEPRSLTFSDVPGWAEPYVRWAYWHGCAKGTASDTFQPEAPISLDGYLTFLLRALGYSDARGDFSWDAAGDKAAELGLLTAEEHAALAPVPMTRGVLADLSLQALGQRVKDGSLTLAETLVERGVLTREAALAAGLSCTVETGTPQLPAGRYTEGYLWDSPVTPIYPVTVLEEEHDPEDPMQQGFPYGYGGRTAFAAADGSWQTGYGYYTGFSGCQGLLTDDGIFAIADEHHWALLDFDGKEKWRIYREDAQALYRDLPVKNGVCILPREEGQRPLGYDWATGAVLDFPHLLSVRHFSPEGLAAATADDTNYGYIDKSGAWAIQPRFQDNYSFQNGRAVVRFDAPTWGVIDESGTVLFETRLEEGQELHPPGGGSAHYWVQGGADDQWGTLCWYDDDFHQIPAAIDGHPVRECAGGGLWYDDGQAVRLLYEGETYAFPAGCPVAAVENGLVLLRDGSPDYWNEPTAVARLDGSYVFAPGQYDSFGFVTDVVSGETYIEAGRGTSWEEGATFDYYDRDGNPVWTGLLAQPTNTELALGLGFTPAPENGAFYLYRPSL